MHHIVCDAETSAQKANPIPQSLTFAATPFPL